MQLLPPPASGQSSGRRQQVEPLPLPLPSSVGSICRGIPLLRTKTMPARSGTRDRPPLGPGVLLAGRIDGVPRVVGDEGFVLHGWDDATPGECRSVLLRRNVRYAKSDRIPRRWTSLRGSYSCSVTQGVPEGTFRCSARTSSGPRGTPPRQDGASMPTQFGRKLGSCRPVDFWMWQCETCSAGCMRETMGS